MTAEDQSDKSPPVKDRSLGLIIFGALQLLMGGCCALLIPLMCLSLLAGPAAASTNLRMLIPAFVMYGVLAVLLIVLGVGSILARRWARSLTLVLAWMWFVMGLVASTMLIFWMPAAFQMSAQNQAVPAEAMIFMQVVLFATMGCLYLALPLAFILFYRSPHVKATCEYKDPCVRWTDRVPLPVLALSLLLGLGSLSMLPSIGYGDAVPFFGIILKGVPGVMVILAVSIVFGYLAWATFRLTMTAWWATVVVYGVLGISTIVTFSRVSLLEFYEEMQFPEDQLRMMKESGMLEQMNVPMMLGLSFSVLFGFLLWVRRHFVAARDLQ